MTRGASFFVGRQRELAELRSGWEEAAAGRGRVFLIEGEAGIGKTRLMEEVAAEAARVGGRALWGRCREGEGAPPYWPWMEILRSYLRGADAESLAAEMGSAAPHIAHLVPELRGRFPHLPAPVTSLESENARFYLFDAIATFLKDTSAKRPFLLVFDDLQWADAPTLLLLEFLAHGIRDARVLLLATCRDLEVRSAPATASILAALARGGHRIPLRGLAAADVRLLIERAAGHPAPEGLVQIVHRETDGNPFFVDEVLRVLAAEGALDHPAEATRGFPVPQGIREAIRRRLAPLSAACSELLTLASVIGREFELGSLARSSQKSVGETLEVLGDAVTDGVVIAHPGAPGRYRFSHALVREALYEELGPAERMRLHRRVGEILEEIHGDDLEPHLAELAHHFLRASVPDSGKGIEYSVRAGRHAAASFAYEEAVEHYRRGLQGLDLSGAGGPAERCRLLLALGHMQWRAGDGPAARETFRRAADLGRKIGDPVLLARGALGFGGEGSRLLWVHAGVVDQSLIRLLEEAVLSLGDGEDVLRSRLLARLAINLYFSPARERGLALSEEAVTLARRSGDPRTLAAALRARYVAVWRPETVDERLAIAAEIVALAGTTGDPEMALPGHRFRIIGFLERGQIDEADREIAAWAEIAVELRQPLYLTHLAMWRAMRAILAGRFGEGEAEAARALELSRQTPEMDGSQQLVTLLGIVRVLRGDLDELVRAVRGFTDRNPTIPTWRCYLAYLYCEQGRLSEARAELDWLARGGFAALPRDAHWVLAMSFLAAVSVAVGDREKSASIYDLLSPFAGRIGVVAALSCWGSVSLYLGLLAGALDRIAEAKEHLEDAIEMHERIGARPLRAYTECAYARVLFASADPADRRKGEEVLRRAEAVATELGLTRLTERIESLRADTLSSSTAGGAEESPHAPATFFQHGEFWGVGFGGEVCHLRDTKGLRTIACLLRNPGREFHSVELAAMAEGHPIDDGPGETAAPAVRALRSTDAGEVLDARARDAYRLRLTELQADFEEAEAQHDAARAARFREEREFLAREISRAMGLGRRARRAGVPAERARVNLTKTIGAALRRIAKAHPALGHHLRETIRTGTFFSYTPPSTSSSRSLEP